MANAGCLFKNMFKNKLKISEVCLSVRVSEEREEKSRAQTFKQSTGFSGGVCAGGCCTVIIISSTSEVADPLGNKNEPCHAISWEG